MDSDEPPGPPPADPPPRPGIAIRPPSMEGDVVWRRERVPAAEEYNDGPLPSGRELKRYREADPEAPRIILEEFRAESRHRRNVERRIVAGESRRADRGQVFALVVMVLGLTLSAILIGSGHDLAGGVIGGVDLLGVAALFLSGAGALRDGDWRNDAEPRPALR